MESPRSKRIIHFEQDIKEKQLNTNAINSKAALIVVA